MEKTSILQKSARLPVPVLPAMVGAITLANVYAGTLGFLWVKHITTVAAMIIWIFALIKILVHFQTFKKEYKIAIPASLYAAFDMLMMLFGAYLFPYFPLLGKCIWFAGIILHVIHILFFVAIHVLKGVKLETFVPTWQAQSISKNQRRKR